MKLGLSAKMIRREDVESMSSHTGYSPDAGGGPSKSRRNSKMTM